MKGIKTFPKKRKSNNMVASGMKHFLKLKNKCQTSIEKNIINMEKYKKHFTYRLTDVFE